MPLSKTRLRIQFNVLTQKWDIVYPSIAAPIASFHNRREARDWLREKKKQNKLEMLWVPKKYKTTIAAGDSGTSD